MACLFIIILTDSSYAIRLNEIESNPEGQDSGNEWVELYSEESVILEGYYLENGDGGVKNLSGSFQGFFVITFQTLWLDNSNETVYLKINNDVVDTVGPFNDNKKNKTYSFCDGEWMFISSTNNEVNACSGAEPPPSQNTQNIEEEQPSVTVEQNRESVTNKIINITPIKTESNLVQQPKKIVLNNNEDNLDVEITKTYKTRIGVIYFFMALCVFLVLLIAMRKL